MKLAAIFICWSDWDWLEHSVKNIADLVDGVFIIGSEKSNYGETFPIPEEWKPKVIVREPIHHHASHSETDKRNYGLNLARRVGYTHFICLDADEMYDKIEFYRGKSYMETHPDCQGLVCRTQVFVKEPTLTIGLDTTLVPFIQKITPDLKHEFNRKFPFAWSGKNILIDPTRSTSATSGIEFYDITMLHYSWVRKDYERKIRNSTARPNIERMNLAHKIVHLKEGDVFDLYPGKPLVRVPNRFAIPGYGDELVKDSIC